MEATSATNDHLFTAQNVIAVAWWDIQSCFTGRALFELRSTKRPNLASSEGGIRGNLCIVPFYPSAGFKGHGVRPQNMRYPAMRELNMRSPKHFQYSGPTDRSTRIDAGLLAKHLSGGLPNAWHCSFPWTTLCCFTVIACLSLSSRWKILFPTLPHRFSGGVHAASCLQYAHGPGCTCGY